MHINRPNLCRIIMIIIVMIGLIVAYMAGVICDVDPLSPLFVFGAIVAFAGIIFGIITIRCPFCHKLLPMKGLSNKYCSHCGEKLD